MLRQVSAVASFMDSNCNSKRRGGGGGFIKGKFRSLCRASSNKVKRSQSPAPPPATDHGGRMTMMNQQKSNMNIISATQYYYNTNKFPAATTSTASSSVGTSIVNQGHLPKHLTTKTGGAVGSYNANAAGAARTDALYGGLQGDETVDLKAAKYISSVLERFRLEHLN